MERVGVGKKEVVHDKVYFRILLLVLPCGSRSVHVDNSVRRNFHSFLVSLKHS